MMLFSHFLKLGTFFFLRLSSRNLFLSIIFLIRSLFLSIFVAFHSLYRLSHAKQLCNVTTLVLEVLKEIVHEEALHSTCLLINFLCSLIFCKGNIWVWQVLILFLQMHLVFWYTYCDEVVIKRIKANLPLKVNEHLTIRWITWWYKEVIAFLIFLCTNAFFQRWSMSQFCITRALEAIFASSSSKFYLNFLLMDLSLGWTRWVSCTSIHTIATWFIAAVKRTSWLRWE